MLLAEAHHQAAHNVIGAMRSPQLMQDCDVARGCLALYVINNRVSSLETVLEVKGKELLTFKDVTKTIQ